MKFIKESLLSEDIDDDSDSIFADDPLDEVEDEQTNEGYHKDRRPGDVRVGVAKDGKPLYGRRVSQTLEPEKHSLDKVTYSKSGKPLLGKAPVDFEYDEDDNLIAVNAKEKEMLNNVAYYKSEIKRDDKKLSELRNRLRFAKRDLEKPYVNHYEVKEKIDNLFDQIKQIEDRKVNKKILVNALTKKYNEIYKS